MRVTIIQVDVDPAGPAVNHGKVQRLLEEAPSSDLFLLPELWSTGYHHVLWDHAADVSTPRLLEWMRSEATRRRATVAGSMVSRRDDGHLVNRFWWVSPSGNAEYYDKTHLFEPLRERELLAAGSAPGRFTVHGWRVAASLCYDLRFPEQYRRDALHGAQLFAVASAWPEPRCLALRTLAQARATENQIWLVLCNRCGPSEGEGSYCGNSMVVAPSGEIVADAGPSVGHLTFAIEKEELVRSRRFFDSIEDRVAAVDFPGNAADSGPRREDMWLAPRSPLRSERNRAGS